MTQPKQITSKMIMGMLSFLELSQDPFVVKFFSQPDPRLLLPEFKKVIKKQRRRLAMKYHPDLNPVNEKRMKTINQTCDLLLSIQWVPVQRQPSVVFHYSYNFYGSHESTTSSTTWWG